MTQTRDFGILRAAGIQRRLMFCRYGLYTGISGRSGRLFGNHKRPQIRHKDPQRSIYKIDTHQILGKTAVCNMDTGHTVIVKIENDNHIFNNDKN